MIHIQLKLKHKKDGSSQRGSETPREEEERALGLAGAQGGRGGALGGKGVTYIADSGQLLAGVGLFHQTLGLDWVDTMVIHCELGPHEIGSSIRRKSYHDDLQFPLETRSGDTCLPASQTAARTPSFQRPHITRKS